MISRICSAISSRSVTPYARKYTTYVPVDVLVQKCGLFYTKSKEEWLHFFKHRQQYGLVGNLKFQTVDIEEGKVKAQIKVEMNHQAPNGYTHAASIVFLADTACGFGCYAHLPSEHHAFTTMELKSNFISTSAVGHTIEVEAELVHAGSTSQVWDAKVYDRKPLNPASHQSHEKQEHRKLIALFRCTQAILNKHTTKSGNLHASQPEGFDKVE